MTESVITEFSGGRQESVSRMYRYGINGVRVLDSHDITRRLYRFDPSSNIMTELDPAQPQKILRRFVFDNYGMLEETYSFGKPPRTFRYEEGGKRIVMREGGDYGAVGKTFSFEENGVSETAFGRNGFVERVYVFEPGGRAITIRTGGWYGNVERSLTCERIDAAVFRDPEAFLQFLMFTEKSARETEAETEEQVAKIRGDTATAGRNRYAYTGVRHTAGGVASVRPAGKSDIQSRELPVRRSTPRTPGQEDPGIDFIPDADSSSQNASGNSPSPRERSAAIPPDERRRSATHEREELSAGESARIPLDERFRSSREEDKTLTRGRSADIPLEERFGNGENERRDLTYGKSARIPYEERKTGRRMQ